MHIVSMVNTNNIWAFHFNLSYPKWIISVYTSKINQHDINIVSNQTICLDI